MIKEEKELLLSELGHTWILDLDGTLVKHNGYLIDDRDSFLPGAQEFLSTIPEHDMIIFITSRKKQYEKVTREFLQNQNVRYDHIIFDAPYGERILINDKKMSGLKTAVAVNQTRDAAWDLQLSLDSSL